MARRSDRQREALRRARLRTRERDAAKVEPTAESIRTARLNDPSTPQVVRRRLAATTCAWCGGKIEPKARGRIPTWCSAGCRQRAWEQSRAAASGRAAIEVVERVVEVPVRPIPGVEVARQPRHREWVTLLEELTKQLREGGVYERDLRAIGEASLAVNNALEQRLSKRRG
jgi:ribosomal protein L24E